MMKFIDFFLVMYPFMMVPGPAVALVSRSSAKLGVKETNFYIFGILSSITFFSILSIIGIVSIIQSYPTGFKVFKILGSIYLFIIGFKIFISSFKKHTQNLSGNITKTSHSKQYLFGLFTDLANPLSMVGLTSMILGFVDANDEVNIKLGYLITTIISAVLYLYTYAFLFGNKVSRKFITPKMHIFERVAGIMVCFIGLIFLIKAI